MYLPLPYCEWLSIPVWEHPKWSPPRLWRPAPYHRLEGVECLITAAISKWLFFLAYLVLNWWQAKLASVVAYTLHKFGLNFSSFDSYHDGFFLPSRSQLRGALPKLWILCKLTPCPTPINKMSSFSLLWLSLSVITVHFIMSSLSVSPRCLSPDFSECFSGLSNAWVYILAWGHFSRMHLWERESLCKEESCEIIMKWTLFMIRGK